MKTMPEFTPFPTTVKGNKICKNKVIKLFHICVTTSLLFWLLGNMLVQHIFSDQRVAAESSLVVQRPLSGKLHLYITEWGGGATTSFVYRYYLTNEIKDSDIVDILSKQDPILMSDNKMLLFQYLKIMFCSFLKVEFINLQILRIIVWKIKMDPIILSKSLRNLRTSQMPSKISFLKIRKHVAENNRKPLKP
jgi:hypothetical protein